MAKENEFKHESVQDRQSIVKYLNALSQGFAEGRLMFEEEQQKILVEPNGLLDFEIKWRRKSNDARLSLKISWREEQKTVKKTNGHLVMKPTR